MDWGFTPASRKVWLYELGTQAGAPEVEIAIRASPSHNATHGAMLMERKRRLLCCPIRSSPHSGR